MAILIFVLSLVLLVAGAASGYQSLDLLPDVLGVLYALAGAVGVAAAVVTFAIGMAILRIDALAKLVRQSAAPAILDMAPDSEPAPAAPDTTPKIEPASAEDAVFTRVAVEAETRDSDDEPLQADD